MVVKTYDAVGLYLKSHDDQRCHISHDIVYDIMDAIQLSRPAWWAPIKKSFSSFDSQSTFQRTDSFKHCNQFQFWQLQCTLARQLIGSGPYHLRQKKTVVGFAVLQFRLPMATWTNPRVKYGYCRQGKANAPYTSDIASITPSQTLFISAFYK